MPHIRFGDGGYDDDGDGERMDVEATAGAEAASTTDQAFASMAVAGRSSPPSPPSPPSPSEIQSDLFVRALHVAKTIQTAYAPADNPHYVFELVCNGDGSLMAAALSTNEIKLYTYASGDIVSTLQGHKGTITDLCFPDPANPHMLASCALDGTVRLWDARSNQQCCEWSGDSKEEFESLSVGGSSRNLIVAGANAKVLFWDARTRKKVACMEDCHTEPVTQTRFHPRDPSKLVTASVDGLMCVLDTSTTFDEDDCILGILNAGTSIARVDFYGPSLERLWCLTHIETFSLWDLADFSKVGDFVQARQTASDNWNQGWVDYLIRCEYDADSGKLYLIAGTQNGTAGIFPIQTRTPPPPLSVADISLCASFQKASHILSGGHVGVVRSILMQKGSYDGKDFVGLGDADACGGGAGALVGWTGGEDGRICAWGHSPVSLPRRNSVGGPAVRKAGSSSHSHDQRTRPYLKAAS